MQQRPHRCRRRLVALPRAPQSGHRALHRIAAQSQQPPGVLLDLLSLRLQLGAALGRRSALRGERGRPPRLPCGACQPGLRGRCLSCCRLPRMLAAIAVLCIRQLARLLCSGCL